ncbi:MAG: ShlB/FhaC/HecB family hemolysin secretion/activation protein [Bdellovibrionales bacterium]|nr:ShlB/FhaC/HecB family hemolysin secretion/activation protein [Massilia sp.]
MTKNASFRAALFLLTLILTVCANAQAQDAKTAEPLRLPVRHFRVLGNTLLPPARIDAILESFKGERSLVELNDAASAVQALYRQAGYGAVIAYLPPQSGVDGEATIAVVEARIGRVVVLGNRQFSAANIRRSLPLLVEGQTPQVQQLDAQIQLANESPAKQVAVTLEPGQQPGEVDARLSVSEQPTSRWSLNADNTGNAQTGRARAGLGYQNAALWDLDHQLMLQAQTSPEQVNRVKVFSGSYRIPFYRQSLVLDAFGAYSNVDGGTTATAAGAVQFSGRGRVLGLRLTGLLPHLGELDQRLSLGLDRRAYLNNCAIANLPDGACGAAGESLMVQPLTIEYTLRHGGELPFSAHIAISRNLGLGGRYADQTAFDAVRPGASMNFTVLRFGGSLNAALPRDWRVQARLDGQMGNSGLVPGEQFGLAGSTAVRGYGEREITGDRGAVASLELLGPELGTAIGDAVQGLRLLAFIDAGKVWNRLGTPCLNAQTTCMLSSLGGGLRLAAGGRQLRLDLAQAMKATALTDRRDLRLHVQASYTFQ